MRRVVAAAALGLALLAVGAETRAPARAVDERIVVQLTTPPLALAPASRNRLESEQRAFHRALRAAVPQARVDRRYRLVVNGFALTVPRAVVPQLGALPGVADVLPSAAYGVQLDTTPERIGARALWGANLETAGAGIRIGIIDTGIDASHSFFHPAGYTMPPGFPRGQRRFTSAKVIVARAFVPPRSRVPGARLAFDGDSSAHGTHVAGIAAGNARTRADGGRIVSGVAPRAYLGNYKALVRTDQGLSPNGNSPEIVAAIEAAVRDGMNVLNLSIGEPEIEPSRDIVARALDVAAAAGVVPVVAAGNDLADLGAGTISSPANSARAITVAAVGLGSTAAATRLAPFSSAGPTTISLRLKPDVSAPGVEIFSAVPGDAWASFSGTSMAAPHIAGAAALLRDRHPAWTVAQIKSALTQTATNVVDDEGRALTPPFQGGGVVSLTEADAPRLFAQPSSLSFGLVGGRGSAEEVRQLRVSLADPGAAAGVWEASVQQSTRARGVSITLGSTTATVPGELTVDLRVAGPVSEGDFSGFVVLRRGAETRRIPYWGRRSAQRLARHATPRLPGAGAYQATTRGRPAFVTTYRYPTNPRGAGISSELGGPERVFRVELRQGATNFGVVVTEQARGVNVEPRVVTQLDENRLTGYAGLPMHHNPYLDGFRTPVPAAGALSPTPGMYYVVFDSPTRADAGRFRFRVWVNDVTPPTIRVRSRRLARRAPLIVAVTDSQSGVYPRSLRVRVDGSPVPYAFRRGVVRVEPRALGPGRHRLEVRASDYQETKNTENVRRILPNTRVLRTTFRVGR